MSNGDQGGTASEIRWGPRRRLEFIEFRLLWDARINRADICRQFGISAQQASADLATYERLAPDNMRYDRAQRTFLRGAGYFPLLIGGLSDRYLLQLQAIETGVIPRTETWFDRPPPIQVAEVRRQPVDDAVLMAVLDAIRRGGALKVLYHTMSDKPDVERVIAPHALAQGSGRWHARCWDAENAEFRDFNLNRIHRVDAEAGRGVDVRLDLEWETRVDLVLRPNPQYSAKMRASVRDEFRFESEELVIDTRIALLFYLFHEFNLELSSEALPNSKRQLVLVNRDEVESARSAAKEMAKLAIRSAGLAAAR